MVNKTILIGEEQRPVNFGRNFWGEFEMITGKSTVKLLQMDELMSMRNHTVIAYSALKWGLYKPKDGREPVPDFTIAKVGEWLDQRPDAVKEIVDALTQSVPKNESAGESPAS